MKTVRVDLLTEAAELRAEAEQYEEAAAELVEELDEKFESYSEVPDEAKEAYDELEEKRIEAEGNAKSLYRAVVDWGDNGHEEEEIDDIYEFVDGYESLHELGDSVFKLAELSTGGLAAVQDEVAEKSFDFDPERGEVTGGTPKSGYGMVETLRRTVEEQPDGAPVKQQGPGKYPAPSEYPHQVGLFLFEKVNNLNTVGDTDLGNSSLREKLEG